MTNYRLAIIPGDGIGSEVLVPALRVLDVLATQHAFTVERDEFDWSCDRFQREGAMMPSDGLERIAGHDAILLGAVGWPTVPDHESLWGLLIPIRRRFHQYVNLRPIRLRPGLGGPRHADTPVDLVIVRENVEGEYSQVGGRINPGTPQETALQSSVFTRAGIERVVEYAFDVASRRSGNLVSATKSNGIVHTMPFWEEVVEDVAARHGDVKWRHEHIDALAAKLVIRPQDFDVVVGSNLFGDILSDLASAIAGSIGIAPSANLNPNRDQPSMFEPVHGSAPDIAGRGMANPLGALLSTVMMLDHLGQPEAALRLDAAIDRVLAGERVRTPDLGGTHTTNEFGDAVVAELHRTDA